MGEIVELWHLTESPDGPPVISRTGTNRAGAEMLAGRRRAGGKPNEITIGSATFTLDGERLGVRWYETWGGHRSRELARGDVEGVSVEADDRSAAGRETWKVVLRLRGGRTLVPVRRCDREACEEPAARLARALGLNPAVPTPGAAPAEELPGGQYVAMAEAGAGMRPIVDGATTLVGTGEEGSVLIRLGERRPWLLVGADRRTIWARAVELPPVWDGSLEVARAWEASDVFRVREIPGTELEERTWGRSGLPAWSGVWVEMRDGTRVRVVRRLPRPEAEAVVAALARALELPSQRGRSRTYLDERRAESLGRLGGVSGGVDVADRPERPANGGGVIALPYSRDPVDAIRVIRGDGVLRVSVPPVAFWRGWVRQAVILLPVAVILGGCAMFCATPPGRQGSVQTNVVAVSVVATLWFVVAVLLSWGARTELVVADDRLVVETWYAVGRRRREWPIEIVLAIEEEYWSVNAIVGAVAGGHRTRAWVGLVLSENKAERRRLVEIVRAAVGLDVDRGGGDGGEG